MPKPDTDKVATFNEAVTEYLDAVTAAELAIARAEKKMAEAIRVARRSPGPITWRQIGEALGVTYQAAQQRWQGKYL